MDWVKKHAVAFFVAAIACAWIMVNILGLHREFSHMENTAKFLKYNKKTTRNHRVLEFRGNTGPLKPAAYKFVDQRNIFAKNGIYQGIASVDKLPPLRSLLKKKRPAKAKRKQVKIGLLGILFDGERYHAVVRKGGQELTAVGVGSIVADGMRINKITDNSLVIGIAGRSGKGKTYRLFNFSPEGLKKNKNITNLRKK